MNNVHILIDGAASVDVDLFQPSRRKRDGIILVSCLTKFEKTLYMSHGVVLNFTVTIIVGVEVDEGRGRMVRKGSVR